jgi:hypothetical protein
MLKTVSSITNAIGALNYKGTWNASTNTPTIVSATGVKGDYYVVSVAGTTTIDGISNWGVGDWIAFNGAAWQRVEGGADLNGVNLSVSGTSTLSGLTASTALALNASKEVVSVTNTGTGNNVLATTPTLVGDVTLSTGNLVIGTAGKGIDFSADPSAAGMTSELLDDYEEGTWTPGYAPASGSFTSVTVVSNGYYRKIGDLVFFTCDLRTTGSSNLGTASGILYITGLPFTTAGQGYGQATGFQEFNLSTAFTNLGVITDGSATQLYLTKNSSNGSIAYVQATELETGAGNFNNLVSIFGMYRT